MLVLRVDGHIWCHTFPPRVEISETLFSEIVSLSKHGDGNAVLPPSGLIYI